VNVVESFRALSRLTGFSHPIFKEKDVHFAEEDCTHLRLNIEDTRFADQLRIFLHFIVLVVDCLIPFF